MPALLNTRLMWSVVVLRDDLVAEPGDRRAASATSQRCAVTVVPAGRGLLGQLDGLGHRVGVDVARGDRAPLGGELDDELAAHAGAATGDDGELPLERFHGGRVSRSRCQRPALRRVAR